MSEAIDHARCSELLRSFEAGALDGPEHDAVARHLSTCAQCRAELGALRALTATSQVEPLTDVERARLKRGVERGIARAPIEEGSRGEDTRRGKTWVAPALGAAALLVLVAVGVASLAGSSGQGDLATPGPALKSAPDSGGGGAGSNQASEEGSSGYLTDQLNALGASSAPVFAARRLDLDSEGPGRLKSAARSFASLGTNVHTNALDITARRAAARLDDLASRAPASLRAQVGTCERAARASSSRPLLPVLGARATFEGRAALLLGFVTGSDETIDSYEVWVWRIGDCDAPLERSSGRLER